MSRATRSGYPEYVRYATRFDPGLMQKEMGIPASLIHRARRGEVENFSDKTLSKFREVYTRYWENRLDRAGITPDNWKLLIKQHDLKELRETVRGYENTRKWDRKLERGGVNPDEREKILRYETEKEIIKRIEKNRETAERIVERRRERDRKNPLLKDYKDSWHSVEFVLRQMSRDLSRISSDWDWIAKHGSPKRKKAWIPGPSKRRDRQYEH